MTHTYNVVHINTIFNDVGTLCCIEQCLVLLDLNADDATLYLKRKIDI